MNLVNPYRFAVQGVIDPPFANVGLLLHMDGSNGGTTFTDSSSNAHTVSRVGAVTSTAQSKFGGSSGLISTVTGNGNKLTVPHHASLNELTGDFTIEGWIYLTTLNVAQVVFIKATSTGNYPYQVYVAAANRIGMACINSGGTQVVNILATTILSANTWYFWQMRRLGERFSAALNGVEETFVVLGGSTTLFSNTDVVAVGNFNSGATLPVIGHLDDVRFTKGVALSFNNRSTVFPDS